MEAHQYRWFPEGDSGLSYESETIHPKQATKEFCDDTIRIASVRGAFLIVAHHGAGLFARGDSPKTEPPEIYDDRSARWVAAHAQELYSLYPDQWILVEGETLVAHSMEPADLEEAAEKHGLKSAFVTRVIAPSPQSQRLIYVVT